MSDVELEVAEPAQEDVQSAAVALIDKADEKRDSIKEDLRKAQNFLKSVGTESGDRIKVKADDVKSYIESLRRLTNEVSNFSWPKDYEIPQVRLVLRKLEIEGDLDLKIDIPAFIRSTLFSSKTKLTFDRKCENISLSWSEFSNVEILISESRSENENFSILALGAVFKEGLKVKSLASENVSLNLKGAKFAASVVVEGGSYDVARFTDAKFEEWIQFKSCKVSDAIFNRADFSRGWFFQDVEFNRPPEFFGASMDRQHTEIAGCSFERAGSFFGATATSADVARFRSLRTHFSKCKDIHLESEFYALEQRAMRLVKSGSIFDQTLSFFYDATSGYGSSIGRPIALFFTQILIFSGLYSLFGSATHGRSVLGQWWALGLSLQNSFNPLVLFSEKGAVMPNDLFTYLMSLGQAVMAVIFVALFLVALRARFRKGGGGEST